MDYSIQLVENLISEIFKYNHGIPNNEFSVLIMDELESPHYADGSYKLIHLSNRSYSDYHYQVSRENHTKYYDIFVLEKEELDQNQLYQVTFCNSYTNIVRFQKDRYRENVTVSNFENPGMVYSFYDGSILIVESCNPSYSNYQRLNV